MKKEDTDLLKSINKLSQEEKTEVLNIYKNEIKKITNVRYKDGHISHLKVDGVETKREVIYNDIDKNNAVYCTYPYNKWGSVVHIDGKWLSTNANATTKDNLGDLPIF